MSAPPAKVPKGIRSEQVSDWFADHIDGVVLPLRFTLITGGSSNLTYRVEDAAGEAFVLRRPPVGIEVATAHDVAREHRIISALAGTPVPVPRARGLCEDDAVNDAAFYVMDFAEGVVLHDDDAAGGALDDAARRDLGNHVVAVLADLHALDPDDVGLGDLGRREDYLARQVLRWRKQWERTKTRELALMEDVADGLEVAIPAQEGSAIVHGDYRLGNMIVNASGRVGAVLDWELCTLGDPLADVGYLLNNWTEPGESSPVRLMAKAPTACGGFPSRAEFVDAYARRTGRDVSGLGYYRAFQYWRLAAIVEGGLARYLAGAMGDQADTDRIARSVERLAQAAAAMLDRA